MNSIKLVIYIICSYILLITLNFFFYELSDSNFYLFYISKITVITVLLVLHGLLLKNIVQKNQDKKGNYPLSIISISLIIIIVELIFSFIGKSHHVEITYSSIIWQKRHYHLNSNGFRDAEFTFKNGQKPALVFLGDSYTAGYGINKTENRFSDIVGQKLSDKFEYYNLGVKATGLKNHRAYLEHVSNKDKILIYQIFINDLDDYCLRNQPLYDIYSNFCKYDFLWAKSMFFLNYIYFTYPNKKIIDEYYTYFSNCNLSKTVLDNYLNDLVNTLNDADKRLGFHKIFILVMPTLGDMDASIMFEKNVYNKISEYSKIKIIDIRNELAPLNIKERIVNLNDTHASILSNQIIANKILEYIE